MPHRRLLAAALPLLLVLAGAPAAAEEVHGGHDHTAHDASHGPSADPRRLLPHDHDPAQAPFGCNLGCLWRACWKDKHHSACGTPYVHAFLTEPAFLGRDLYVTAAHRRGAGERETEVEVELEWALARRVGLIAEIPWIHRRDGAGRTVEGFGDLAVGVRALLCETSTGLLSAFVEVEAPTGDEARDLGEGQWILGGGLGWWLDLGSWWTWQGSAGLEVLTDDGETEFVWSTALARSLPAPFLFCPCTTERHGEHAQHVRHGVLSLLVEAAGVTEVETGETQAELLLGVSHTVSHAWEARAGLLLPLTDDTEFDWGITAGFVLHL